MVFAGVSVIADGELLEGSTKPTFNAGAVHLLVVQGHSRTVAPFDGLPIKSHSFIIGGHPWCIQYYPQGFWWDGFVSIFLCHTRQDPVKAQFKFSFIDEIEKQEPARIRASRMVFLFNGLSVYGYDTFVKRNDLLNSKHLKNNTFTIRCDVVVVEDDMASPSIEVPPSDMKQNFTDLLLAGKGTDVTFQVDDETFAAHRCVLAARSPVFNAFLFGPMKEGSTTTVVKIDDIDATVFKALLGFIYGVSVAEEDGVLFQHLLVAADKYGLGRLKAMCDKKLGEHIIVGTATTILALAEQHQCNGLKAACYEFLRSPANLKAVVSTEGFDHLSRSCPTVMKDLILGVLESPK